MAAELLSVLDVPQTLLHLYLCDVLRSLCHTWIKSLPYCWTTRLWEELGPGNKIYYQPEIQIVSLKIWVLQSLSKAAPHNTMSFSFHTGPHLCGACLHLYCPPLWSLAPLPHPCGCTISRTADQTFSVLFFTPARGCLSFQKIWCSLLRSCWQRGTDKWPVGPPTDEQAHQLTM